MFVYGGFNLAGRRRRAQLRRRRRPAPPAGGPAAPAGDHSSCIKRDRDGEDQRLYYVALTRARKRLYLPYSGNVPEGDASPFDSPPAGGYWKLVGGYRHVNRRLRELVNEPDTRRLLDPHEIEIDARARRRRAGPARAAALAAWRPDARRRRADRARPDARRAAPRARRRGDDVVQPHQAGARRLPAAHGDPRRGRRGPTDAHDDDGELRGGAATGIFLHALLEVLPLRDAARDAGARRLERARRRARRRRSRCCAGTAAIPGELRARPATSRTPR